MIPKLDKLNLIDWDLIHELGLRTQFYFVCNPLLQDGPVPPPKHLGGCSVPVCRPPNSGRPRGEKIYKISWLNKILFRSLPFWPRRWSERPPDWGVLQCLFSDWSEQQCILWTENQSLEINYLSYINHSNWKLSAYREFIIEFYTFICTTYFHPLEFISILLPVLSLIVSHNCSCSCLVLKGPEGHSNCQSPLR